jgi:DNA invertase Pin-like site-specific DNA recombinase
LLIAKLDRLSRRVSFIFALREAAIKFRALDMPEVQDVLTLSIYAGLAEQERNLISRRTKDALAALKAQGKKLGTNNLTNEGRAKGAATMKRLAEENTNNLRAAAQARKLHTDGHSLNTIAKMLNEQGIKTARGGKHSATSVMRLLKRF